MNQYQEYLLQGNLSSGFLFDRCCLSGEEGNPKHYYGKFDKDTDTYTITQDRDIHLLKYVLLVSVYNYKFLENVFVWKDKSWKEAPVTKEKYLDLRGNERTFSCYRIDVDFRDKTEKLRFCFKGGLADDYILKLQYVEADKEAYYAEQAKTTRENLIKAASIKHATGSDLVNIYFQPCCDEYERTEITLFRDGQMLAKYKVEEDAFFKSIGGLAYGAYEYVVKQFGKDGKVLFESDPFEFSIGSSRFVVRR